MSLSNPSNPKEVRRLLHAVYEPYAQGIVSLPRKRIVGDIDTLPEITQPIASALMDAWAQIDSSRAVHKALVGRVLENPRAVLTHENGRLMSGIIMSQIGRNSLTEVIFTPIVEKNLVLIETNQIGPRAAAEEYLANHSITLYDGRTITGGGFDESLQPDVDLIFPTGQDRVGRVVHFEASLSEAA